MFSFQKYVFSPFDLDVEPFDDGIKGSYLPSLVKIQPVVLEKQLLTTHDTRLTSNDHKAIGPR